MYVHLCRCMFAFSKKPHSPTAIRTPLQIVCYFIYEVIKAGRSAVKIYRGCLFTIELSFKKKGYSNKNIVNFHLQLVLSDKMGYFSNCLSFFFSPLLPPPINHSRTVQHWSMSESISYGNCTRNSMHLKIPATRRDTGRMMSVCFMASGQFTVTVKIFSTGLGNTNHIFSNSERIIRGCRTNLKLLASPTHSPISQKS